MPRRKPERIPLFSPSAEWKPLSGRGRNVYNRLPGGMESILDIGGGEGYISRHFGKKFDKVYELELSFRRVSIGKKWYPYIDFVNGSAEEIPFKDKAFDAVTLIEVLEHLDDEKKAIFEIARILKPNGIFVITVPHRGLFGFFDPANLKRKFSLPYSLYNKLCLKRKADGEGPLREHRHYRLTELQALMGGFFTIKSVEVKGLFLSEFVYFLMTRFFRYRGFFTRILQRLIDTDLMFNYGFAGSQLLICAVRR